MGQPLVLDPGTYKYTAGKWRDYFRRTRAHSTATVDGVSQSEFYGAFRVGHMAHTRLCESQIERLPHRIKAEHDGYRRLSDPVTHQRTVAWSGGSSFRISDTFLGREEHTVEITIHLSPCAIDDCGPEKFRANYEDGTVLTVRVQGPSPGSFSVDQGWISETWYEKIPTPVIVYKFMSALPQTVTMIYRIHT